MRCKLEEFSSFTPLTDTWVFSPNYMQIATYSIKKKSWKLTPSPLFKLSLGSFCVIPEISEDLSPYNSLLGQQH